MAVRGVIGWRGDRLRAARAAAGLTQAALAARVGVAVWTVYAWERRDRAPTAAHLARLATVLGVDAAWLAPPSATPTLRELRQQAGLSQAEVARRLGRAEASVAAVERARWWPSDANAWAAVYGVDKDSWQRAWRRGRS